MTSIASTTRACHEVGFYQSFKQTAMVLRVNQGPVGLVTQGLDEQWFIRLTADAPDRLRPIEERSFDNLANLQFAVEDMMGEKEWYHPEPIMEL